MGVAKKLLLLLMMVMLVSMCLPIDILMAQGTTVEVNFGNTITLNPGDSIAGSASGGIPVEVRNLPDLGAPENGLAAFVFNFNWDKDVIRVDSVFAAATMGWTTILAGVPDNTNGTLTVTGFTLAYSTDDIILLYLGITAVGNVGDSTSIDVTITDLGDKDANPIPATPVNAPVTILGLVSSTLVSIEVTPAAPSILSGLPQQFEALGTYTDGSEIDITDVVSWTSNDEAIATIQTTGEANPGLATCLVGGTTTITATHNDIYGATTLTVIGESKGTVTPPTVTPPTVTPPTVTKPSVTEVATAIDENGVFAQKVTVESSDGKVELVINEGTVSRTKEDAPLSEISITGMEESPAPPVGARIIGLCYDLAPDGATFEPPITLTFTYDSSEIPEGFNEEDLVIASWDGIAGKWTALESCTVDVVNHTIQAQVSHFTTFSVLAYTRPGTFTISNLTIFPAEVDIGENLGINVLVTNTGDLTGSYEVTLRIDNIIVAAREVTLAGGASETVTFTTTRDVSGTFKVNVDGISGAFTVRARRPMLINWWLVGGIIAGVLLLGLGSYFMIRRRG